MLEVSISANARHRIQKLDDKWEEAVVGQLPFPLAYVMTRMRQEEVPWDLLLKDALNVLLRYIALLGASEYLADEGNPDFDVNDDLKNLGRVMSEGQWLSLARACAARKTTSRLLPGLASGLLQLEEHREYAVRLRFEAYGLSTGPLGILSALVAARNKLFAHGISPSPGEKAHASPELRSLLRLALDVLSEVWSYDLCMPVLVGDDRRYFLLRGAEHFCCVTPPANVSSDQGFLRLQDGRTLTLHPLALAEPVGARARGTFLDQSAELYLLNYLERSSIPVFLGMGGSSPRRTDLSKSIEFLFNNKDVWKTREDIQLDQVLRHAAKRTAKSLEYFEWNNLYDRARYVERQSVQVVLDGFLADGSSRLLFIAGSSGAGKTAASIHWAHQLLTSGVPVCMVRAVEMPPRETGTGKRLGNWLCEMHGYVGTFGQMLDYAAETGPGKFVVILDGLNEFLAKGRDLDGLWRAINELVEEHGHCAALKILVTTRVDGDGIHMYFPNGAPPAFAAPALFYSVNGKPWFALGGFTPEEVGTALQAYGVDAETVTKVRSKYEGPLATPGILARYAQGVLRGDELKKVSLHGVTKQFVANCLAREPRLHWTLDRLIAVLAKNKSLAMPLDEIASHDSRLYRGLTDNNHHLLHRMRELGLVSVLRTENQQGRPATSVSMGDDSLYEHLWFRRRIRENWRQLFRLVPGLGVCLVIACAIFVPSASHIVAGTLHTQVQDTFDGIRAAVTDPMARMRLDELRSMSLSLEGETVRLIPDFVRVMGSFALLNVLPALLLPVCLWGLISMAVLWLERRRTGDFRVRYLSAAHGERISKKCCIVAFLLAAGAVAWTALRAGTASSPRTELAELITVMAPLLCVLLAVTLFGPVLTILMHLRAALRSGSESLTRIIHDLSV